MGKLFNRVLNFVNWEVAEDEEAMEEEGADLHQPQFVHNPTKKSTSKVVSIHSSNQLKVVIMHPESFDDAQGICDHLKNKKPVVINLEDIDKDTAQRIVDFMSGAVYSLDGTIQKVSNGIFIIAPNNVDLMGDFKDELKNKAVFPWMK